MLIIMDAKVDSQNFHEVFCKSLHIYHAYSWAHKVKKKNSREQNPGTAERSFIS